MTPPGSKRPAAVDARPSRWLFTDAFILILLPVACVLPPAVSAAERIKPEAHIRASTTAPGTSATGPTDGDRFSAAPQSMWKGEPHQGRWWWEVVFSEPRRVGSILQIHGDKELVFLNGPKDYMWQWTADGSTWQDLPETRIVNEQRMYRLHRLTKAREVLGLRLLFDSAVGDAPALREVELFPEADTPVPFPDWAIIVFTEPKVTLPPNSPHLFVRLIRECEEWAGLHFQQVSFRHVDEDFVAAEPRPLCALLTGSDSEHCQVDPTEWRGFEQVLKSGHLPMWAACGGAQVLAILWEHGTQTRWDCPRCRDPNHPLTPVYRHIGHTGEAPCGDYSKNIGERGKYQVRLVAKDPAFEGLPELFETMEAHIGEIAYIPSGWVQVVTKGPKGLTENQCLRRADRYIYAAQFHIELPGTPEPSRRIISNFLRLAKEWGGYNPAGRPVPPPEPIAAEMTESVVPP